MDERLQQILQQIDASKDPEKVSFFAIRPFA